MNPAWLIGMMMFGVFMVVCVVFMVALVAPIIREMWHDDRGALLAFLGIMTWLIVMAILLGIGRER